jgi:hypothetical protein
MVNHINFKQLTASNEIACDFNVRFGWSGFTAYAANGISGVIPHPVLCRMAHDLSDLDLVEPLSYAA